MIAKIAKRCRQFWLSDWRQFVAKKSMEKKEKYFVILFEKYPCLK
jgi:hypothetical protein